MNPYALAENLIGALGVTGADGGPMNPVVCESLRADTAALFGVSPHDVLVVPWVGEDGEPVVPIMVRPPHGTDDRMLRLPPTMNVEYAWLPYFWLDPEARRRDVARHESDDAFAIRMWLTLVDRGYLVAPDEFISPFDASSLESAGGFTERLVAYRDGKWDADLTELVIGPAQGGMSHDDLRVLSEAIASELHYACAASMTVALLESQDRVRNILTQTKAWETRASTLMDALLVAGQHVQNSSPAMLHEHRHELHQAVAAILTHTAEISLAACELHLLTSGVDMEPLAFVEMCDDLFALDAARHSFRGDQADTVMAQIYAAPADDAPYRALWSFANDAYRAVFSMVTTQLEVANQFLEMSWVPIPLEGDSFDGPTTLRQRVGAHHMPRVEELA